MGMGRGSLRGYPKREWASRPVSTGFFRKVVKWDLENVMNKDWACQVATRLPRGRSQGTLDGLADQNIRTTRVVVANLTLPQVIDILLRADRYRTEPSRVI
jgi:hypothetical protein